MLARDSFIAARLEQSVGLRRLNPTYILDWLRAHPAQQYTLQSLARKASMSIRTLQRKFRESTGMSPHEWLTRERVAIAKELLESSRMSLLKVAEKSGFTSPESFRRHFRLIAETSPSAYRQRFRGL